MKIDVYSHGLVVSGVVTERDLHAMMAFCKPMVEYGLEKKGKRFFPKPVRTYASATKNRQEFHFHRNQLDELKNHLFSRHGYSEKLVPIKFHEINFKDVPEVEFNILKMFPPRPVQVPIIEYVLNRDIPGYYPKTRMVTLQPGGGKTFIAQYCMNKIQRRTAIHFKGGYIERWKGDLEQTFDLKKGELLIVRGSKDLKALMTIAKEGELNAKVIIITTATMREYIKDYEESNGRSKLYPVKPIDFYKTLGVGVVVKDELHQEFHNTFKMDIHTHVPLILGLSATMTSSDKFKNRMHDIAYPIVERNDGGGIHRYIGVTEVRYHMDENIALRYKGAQGYSHIMFEESIMRHGGILRNYMRIVENEFYRRFVQRREEGQKAIVFFARVDLCTHAVERFQKLYPELTIARYVGSENDSYEEMLEADVIVSTLGSAGTAIDIPNLRITFMTTAIDSRQSNEQVLGRTRPLKDWPDITPEFIYFSCMEIDKHSDYSRNKKEFFKNRALYHKDEISSKVLCVHSQKK